jgi:hypothetical protein
MKPKHRSPVGKPPKEIDPRYVRKIKSAEHKALSSMQVTDTVELEPELIEELQRRALELHPEGMVGKPPVELSKPQQAATAIWLRSQGVTFKEIERRTGLKFDTVRALCWRQQDTLETKRKEFSRRYAQVAETFTDLMFEKAQRMLDNPEQLDALSPDRLAMTVGIMTDKAAQLSGMAGTIIEHRKGASIEDAEAFIKQARARVAARTVVEAVVVTDD